MKQSLLDFSLIWSVSTTPRTKCEIRRISSSHRSIASGKKCATVQYLPPFAILPVNFVHATRCIYRSLCTVNTRENYLPLAMNEAERGTQQDHIPDLAQNSRDCTRAKHAQCVRARTHTHSLFTFLSLAG